MAVAYCLKFLALCMPLHWEVKVHLTLIIFKMQNWIFQENHESFSPYPFTYVLSNQKSLAGIVFQNIELSLKIHTPILVFTVITDVFADEKKSFISNYSRWYTIQNTWTLVFQILRQIIIFFFIKDRYQVREDRNSETPMTYLMLQPLCWCLT